MGRASRTANFIVGLIFSIVIVGMQVAIVVSLVEMSRDTKVIEELLQCFFQVVVLFEVIMWDSLV